MTTVYTHTQVFYTISFDTPDIGDDGRKTLANAAAALQNDPTILIALSVGGRGVIDEPPEISLVFSASTSDDQYTAAVQDAVNDAFQKEHAVTLEQETCHYNFTDGQKEHIAQSTSLPDNLSGGVFQNFIGSPTVERVSGPITHGDYSFSIQQSRRDALLAPDASLYTEFNNFRTMFQEVSVQSRVSAAIVLMMQQGVVTISQPMWAAFMTSNIAGSLITAIEPLISAIGSAQFWGKVKAIANALASLPNDA